MVLDLVETLDCPAVIARIYNSHLHEDKTLPFTTVTLTDVHALHRTQSRYLKLVIIPPRLQSAKNLTACSEMIHQQQLFNLLPLLVVHTQASNFGHIVV